MLIRMRSPPAFSWERSQPSRQFSWRDTRAPKGSERLRFEYLASAQEDTQVLATCRFPPYTARENPFLLNYYIAFTNQSQLVILIQITHRYSD